MLPGHATAGLAAGLEELLAPARGAVQGGRMTAENGILLPLLFVMAP